MDAAQHAPLALEGWVNFMLKPEREEQEECVLRYLMGMRLETILDLEQRCPLLEKVMREQHWWELLYTRWFPVTYERLQQAAVASNAKQYLGQKHLDYRGLWVAQTKWLTFQENSTVVETPKGTDIAISLADEFGLGSLFATRSPQLLIGTQKNKQWEWTASGNPHKNDGDDVHIEAFVAIPLQGKAILRVTREGQEGTDLVMLNVVTLGKEQKEQQQLTFAPQAFNEWAINYPDGDPLDLPPTLRGDPTLEMPSIAATEKNAQRASVQHNGALAVFLDRVTPPPYDMLFFDQLYQKQDAAAGSPHQRYQTWHSLCTSRVKMHVPITSMCYVLDAFLLMAAADGTLWARPRNNPRSLYFVDQLPGPITFMTSLHNVVAFLCDRNQTLQVKHVVRIAVDPFIQLEMLHTMNSAASPFCASQPFLFGPYLLYQTAEMEMDDPEEPEQEEERNSDDDIPAHIKKGKNWYRNRWLLKKANKERFARYARYVHYVHDKPQEDNKKEKPKKPTKPAKRGAEYALLNYETKIASKVDIVLAKGWRLSHVKFANHSHWVITVCRKRKLADVVLVLQLK